MSEYRSLVFIIIAIFAVLGLGAYLSPTFTQQMGYAQSFIFFGALLFIASVVVIVAAFGFHTFSLYIAVLTGMAIATFGIYGGLLVLLLTYSTWGFVFGIELLLAYNDVHSAINWFESRYTYKAFLLEYRLFYPMLWLMYFLLEVVPHLVCRDKIISFYPKKILYKMRNLLPE